MARDRTSPPVVTLTEAQRQEAMARFAVLQPHLDEDVPLARVAREARVPLRTAERWLARYRQRGLAGLARPVRRDAAIYRLPADLVTLLEGLGLTKPRASAAAIHRRVRDVAIAHGWQGDRILSPCNDVDRRLENDLIIGSRVVDQCSTLLLLLEI